MVQSRIYAAAGLILLFMFHQANAFPFPLSPDVSNTTLVHSVAVFGKDNRTPSKFIYPELETGIGVLVGGTPGQFSSCTAFCVSDTVIATNAHCLVRNPVTRKRMDLNNTLFVIPRTSDDLANPGYMPRASKLQIVDPKQPSLSVYSGHFRSMKSAGSIAADWALARLKFPVCRNRVLPVETVSLKTLKRASRKRKVFMIGFHGDRADEGRLLSRNCSLHPRNKQLIRQWGRRHVSSTGVLLPHTCDSYQGSSGSPLFIETKDGPKVVGINASSLTLSTARVLKNRVTGKVIYRAPARQRAKVNVAVRPQAFLKGVSRFETETLLSSLEELQQAQKLLKQLGFYKGKIDGDLGPATRRAVQRFEKKLRLAMLGMPTRELLMKLEEVSANPEAWPDFSAKTSRPLVPDADKAQVRPKTPNWDGRWMLSTRAVQGCWVKSRHQVITVRSGRFSWSQDRRGSISNSGRFKAEGSCSSGNCHVYFKGRVKGHKGHGTYQTDNGKCEGEFTFRKL